MNIMLRAAISVLTLGIASANGSEIGGNATTTPSAIIIEQQAPGQAVVDYTAGQPAGAWRLQPMQVASK